MPGKGRALHRAMSLRLVAMAILMDLFASIGDMRRRPDGNSKYTQLQQRGRIRKPCAGKCVTCGGGEYEQGQTPASLQHLVDVSCVLGAIDDQVGVRVA